MGFLMSSLLFDLLALIQCLGKLLTIDLRAFLHLPKVFSHHVLCKLVTGVQRCLGQADITGENVWKRRVKTAMKARPSLHVQPAPCAFMLPGCQSR